MYNKAPSKSSAARRAAGGSRPAPSSRSCSPYRLVSPEESLLSETPTANGDDQRPLILLVEDNNDLAAYITESLTPTYRVERTDNGSAGLRSALDGIPDLIISDVLMPVMDGFELCQRLKGDIRTSHIPVILLTAKSTQENRIEGLSLGANDYLTKPFHPTELGLRIRNLLDQQERIRRRFQSQLAQPGQPIAAANQPTPENQPVEDPFLTRIHQVIDEHLDDSLFGVEELVRLLDMSRTSLHRKIKAVTNGSTTELVRNYRLKKAAALLRQGHTSTATAYLCGFGSPAYFTKCFRELYQLTPGEFIQQITQSPAAEQ